MFGGKFMRDLEDVTVGLKTFYRTKRLEMTLNSLIGLGVKEVIIADDGPDDPIKEEIYEKMRQYLPLKVLKLPYDAGLGYGRKEIVKHTKTEYLLIIDDDMKVPNNIYFLKNILERDKLLGGVSGCWIEYGNPKCDAYNLDCRDRFLIRHDPDNIKINITEEGIPYVYFDFIPNSALFRRRAIKDYCWDENYIINFEHLDFYWGHKQLGKWKFAATPTVFFEHYPGGSKTYKKFRLSKERYKKSREYFLKKWDLKGIISIKRGFWWQNVPPKTTLWLWLKSRLPFRVLKYIAMIERTLR